MNTKAPTIALVRLTALGDIINGTIVLQLIKKHYPQAKITWFCEAAFAPILQAHPDLEAVISVPIKKIKKERDLSLLKESIHTLKNAGDFDIVIDMQGLLKSAIVAKFIAKNRHGFDKDSAREGIASWFYTSTSNIPYINNVIRRNIDVVADALEFKVTDQEILEKRATFASQKVPSFLETQTKNIIFIIGASWPSKIYPKEKFAALAQSLKPYHCHIIHASEAEAEDARYICEQSDNATMAPKLSLQELIGAVEHCDLLIGNDTGPTHLAWAMNRPSIALFGPTNTRMIYETPINLACESNSHVDITKINKDDFSIQEIEIAEIATKAKLLLEQ